MSFLKNLNNSRFFSSSPQTNRLFANVINRNVEKQQPLRLNDPDTLLPRSRPKYPPYPYGSATFYKQSDRGLYGGKVPQFGHQVSEKFNQKHKRTFHPNVQTTTLYSDILKRQIRVKLVTSVLRTITKEGGIDNYLLKDTPARIKELGLFGWRLRYDVLMRLKEHERTQFKPIDGLQVGKARLIKDLFNAMDHNIALKEFRAKYRDSSADELLHLLSENGVDVKQYSE